MPGLLRDRYFEYAPDRAWDLVTGEAVSPIGELQDDDGESRPVFDPLIELLDHGREGSPRWFELDATPPEWRLRARLAAAVARRRGYVAVAVDVFLRMRTLLADELRTRAMVLIARPDASADLLRAALLHAAAISPGPHVLLTSSAKSVGSATRWHAAEARAAYSAGRVRTVAPVRLPEDVSRLLDRARRSNDLVQRGRHAAAERLLRESAAALARRRAAGPAAETYIALGQLLLERGGVVAADNAFEEAAVQSEGVDDRLLATARIWQAAARTDAGQLSAAESLCRAVLLTLVDGDEERRCAEAALARVLLWQGRVAEAVALPFARTTSSIVFVEAMGIRVLLEGGECFDAGRRARDLLDATKNLDATSRLIAMGAHLRVLLAAGDLGLAAETLRAAVALTRAARTPLRLARLRLLWSQALKRAGKTHEANRELHALVRMRSAMPPLLRMAIDRSARTSVPPVVEPPRETAAGDAAILVTLAQREEGDDEALTRVCEFVLQTTLASRVELWTADAGPATAIVTCGAGLGTRLGARALEAGTVIGPEVVASGREVALPIRLGPRLIGALAVRWTVDRAGAGESLGLLHVACAVAAPRVDSIVAASRHLAQAARAIPELVGVSAAIADVRRAVSRAAAAPFSVLIEGESGVGKELVARAIHQLGPRRDRRFCDVNCAALPDDLFESELFGHARGAFTGAVSDRPGLVEEADGGTLFLDEVADLSARAQAKLLRVVQQQEVRRVGETFSRKVDVRFVSAANRDLRSECEAGRFRQDLLYRLDVIRIRIPPLRDRPEDIPVLASHFWTAARARVETQASLSHGVLAALARYQWPGNVRELQNVLSALAVEAPARGQVRASLLPAAIAGATPVSSGRLSTARLQWERRFVEVALAHAGGSRTRAARELGLSRQGLLKVLERLKLM